jgi:hypothetical protein
VGSSHPTIVTEIKFNTQNLAVVADFLTIEGSWSFLTSFEENFSFASICSRTFRPYPKFKYAYWFDWVFVVEDLNVARDKIRDCFGAGWIESGDDEIWNAANREELSVPRWANLSQANLITVDEARQLNPEPQLEQGNTFISVSTKGQITGIYPSSKISE